MGRSKKAARSKDANNFRASPKKASWNAVYKKLALNLNKQNINSSALNCTVNNQYRANNNASPLYSYKNFRSRMEEVERVLPKELLNKTQAARKYIRLPSILKETKGPSITPDLLQNMEKAKILNCGQESATDYYSNRNEERSLYSNVRINRAKTIHDKYQSALNFAEEASKY